MLSITRRISSTFISASLPSALTSASVSSSQSASSCSVRSIGVSAGHTPRSCTARSMPRLYGRLRNAQRERATRIAGLRGAEHQPALLPRAELEGDLAGQLRAATLCLDSGARDTNRRTGYPVVHRVGDRDHDARPPLAQGRPFDRDPEPL